MITTKKIVALMNRAFFLDPKCMDAFVKTRHKCNENLATHPTIQVSLDGIGVLGILNGIAAMENKTLGAEFDTDTGELIRFLVVTPEKTTGKDDETV